MKFTLDVMIVAFICIAVAILVIHYYPVILHKEHLFISGRTNEEWCEDTKLFVAQGDGVCNEGETAFSSADCCIAFECAERERELKRFCELSEYERHYNLIINVPMIETTDFPQECIVQCGEYNFTMTVNSSIKSRDLYVPFNPSVEGCNVSCEAQ